MHKLIRLLGYFLIALGLIAALVYSNIFVGDINSRHDLLSLGVPVPPTWLMYLPGGGILGWLYEFFSIHGVVSIAIFVIPVYIGGLLVSLSYKIRDVKTDRSTTLINTNMYRLAEDYTYLFLTYSQPDEATVNGAIEAGKEIMSQIYKLHKESIKPNHIYIKTLDNLINKFSDKYHYKVDGNMYFYFDFCRFAAMKCAEGKPEDIKNVMGHVYGRKPSRTAAHDGQAALF